MLVVVILFQFWQFFLLQKAGEKWANAYQSLEESSQRPLDRLGEEEEFPAFGLRFRAPLPRIDYGAHYTKGKDAKATCLVGRAMLLGNDLQKLRCE